MRVIITEDYEFDIEHLEYKDEWIEVFKNNTVFFKIDGNILTLREQKIDLDPEYVEDVLETIEVMACKTVWLMRYAHGRYDLVLE